ncbi:MAG: M20/M25/M40 family metallo-hydrolase [Acidobacteriota bacterium]
MKRILALCALLIPLPAMGAARVDWKVVEKEATDYLQQYLRIDTTNPPGNETAAAKYLQSLLEKEAIRCRLLESKPGRGNLFAYIDTGGKKRPIILLNHIDVAPAERRYWKEDPFAGVVKDGSVWGRGAIDDKSLGMAQLMTMLLLKRTKAKLNRQVIFLAVADAEGGSSAGAGWITSTKEHKTLIERAEFLLGQGSVIRMSEGKVAYYGVSPTEKTTCWLELRAKGPAALAAFPPFEPTAIEKLAMALQRIFAFKSEVKLVPTVEKFFQDLSKLQVGERKQQFLNIRESIKNAGFLSAVEKNPDYGPMLKSTVAVTSFNTPGSRASIIPAEATATLDCRLLPGESPLDFVSKLQTLMDGTGVEVHPLLLGESSLSPVTTDLFKAIVKIAGQYDKGAIVTTPLLANSTDAGYFRKLGITCYGFEPFKLETAQQLGHSNDERIPLASYLGGVRRMYDLVLAAQ